MAYEYTCKLCGDTFTGESEDGLVIAVQNHYMNQHGLEHESDTEEQSIETDAKAIKKAMEKV
ncbi:MAG: DUF1059 domain-containing protein [Candidatus Nanohaloarchaea archaeon]